MIFETHAHYDDEKFHEDRENLLLAVRDAGVYPIINVGASLRTSQNSLDLAEKYDFIYAAVGVHPDEVEELSEEGMAWLEQACNLPKAIAVGEIGLDYYWHKEEAHHKLQQEWFTRQMQLAKEKKLPIIVHSRDACEDTLRVMREFHAEDLDGIIHCFSYSPEIAREYVKMGFMIGVGGVVTFSNAKKLVEVVDAIPLEHIVVETDCPYLAPVPNRGKRNDSRNIRYVIDKIAEIKGVTPEEVERITEENGYKVYAKIPR